MTFKNSAKLAIDDPDGLSFGISPNPLATRHGLLIGGGTVYPELNFTLPAMSVDAANMPAILDQYRQIITGAKTRLAERTPIS